MQYLMVPRRRPRFQCIIRVSRWTEKVGYLVLAMTLVVLVSATTRGAAAQNAMTPPDMMMRRGQRTSRTTETTLRSRSQQQNNLRRLEDAASAYDYDDVGDANGADNDDDNALMNIEQDVEMALKDMFYSAPSEWTGKHWAFFAGMVTTVAIAVGIITACIVSTCCGCSPRSAGGNKPIVVRTQEEHNHYTDALMRDEDDGDDGPLSDTTDEHTDEENRLKYNRRGGKNTGEHSDYSAEHSHSDDYDSGFYSTEDDSSFDDEYIRKRLHRDETRRETSQKQQKSQSSDFELTASHVDYNGPNRRQLC